MALNNAHYLHKHRKSYVNFLREIVLTYGAQYKCRASMINLFGISGSRQKPVTEDVRWAGALAGAYRDSSEMFPLQHESEIYLQQMQHEQKLAY